MTRRSTLPLLPSGYTAMQSWCALESGTQKGGLRLDSTQKHAQPVSIFAFANPEMGP